MTYIIFVVFVSRWHTLCIRYWDDSFYPNDNWSTDMNKQIVIRDLEFIQDMDRGHQAGILGRGVSAGYLFSSAPGRAQAPVFNQFLTIETFEVNNYETNNYIDKLIHQTVNQNQLNLVSVEAGDGGVSVNVNQGQVGSNATV